MSTHEKWMKKFNAGGHESFEEFICNELDSVFNEITGDTREAISADIDQSMRTSMLGELTGDAPLLAVSNPEPSDLFIGDEEVPPTDPNAGGSQDP